MAIKKIISHVSSLLSETVMVVIRVDAFKPPDEEKQEELCTDVDLAPHTYCKVPSRPPKVFPSMLCLLDSCSLEYS